MSQVHIVSFDIPFPPNYGGIVDVYYQIKSLSEKGVSITLHCFQYAEKKRQPHLEELCEKVFYYKRKTGVAGISKGLPYIVYSRRDPLLLQRLAQADGPIILEGIHCCYYLDHPQLKNKVKAVRCMNIESDYYKMLAAQSSLPQKLFFKEEAKRLKRFEPILKNAQHLLTISSRDQDYFHKKFSEPICTKICAFHGNTTSTQTETEGAYALFHGSLDVVENEQAALFLINNVFSKCNYPLIIAGKKPGPALVLRVKSLTHVTLMADPTFNELDELIKTAQMHMMYATQSSGLKLKLVKSLFLGKHVIANDNMITEQGLAASVHLANSTQEWIDAVEKFSNKTFDKEDQEHRAYSLKDFSDEGSIFKLMKTLKLGT